MIIWLASYPKSGNTMLRTMLSSYLYTNDGSFDFNVIGFALGVLMANAGKDLANSVIDGVIMPTLKPGLDRITPQGKATLRIGSIEINLEKLITALIRFICLGLVVYLLIKVGVKMTKPTAWVSIRSVADGVSL